MITADQLRQIIDQLIAVVFNVASRIHGPFGGLGIGLALSFLRAFIQANEDALIEALKQRGIVS